MLAGMSWLAAEAGLAPQADVLTLQRRTYDLWLETLRQTWRLVDTPLLELCRTRMAQIYERPVPVSAAMASRLAELERFRDSLEFTEPERDALDYVEQLMIDQGGITAEQKERLARHLSPGEVADFTFAAFAHDADLRARTLLEIEPDASEPESIATASPEDEKLYLFPAVDPAFSEALGRFGHDASKRSLVDETTTEVCRLRNAVHQQCDL
jgi:hypothetical protein